MGPNEIRNMRVNQILLTNGTMLTVFIIFYTLITIFPIRTTYFFIAIAVMILIQAIYGFIKRDSTNSFIPFLEKVAIYEKQKMGNEWSKTRRAGNGWSVVLSIVMFLQFYISLDYDDNYFEFEPKIMLIITLMIFVLTNISMLLHFRKVDRSTSESDMKGYTWKSNLIGAVAGILFGLAIFVMTIYFIISKF
ncbi:hypothetical protein [Bacillus timonensis]|uniref:hypothetical protein n=1 Tax=Bacillus timonensis TaxID=1033734 RepID=UPI000287A846|nr:hypothetical protein [Bacillus timonensis]